MKRKKKQRSKSKVWLLFVTRDIKTGWLFHGSYTLRKFAALDAVLCRSQGDKTHIQPIDLP